MNQQLEQLLLDGLNSSAAKPWTAADEQLIAAKLRERQLNRQRKAELNNTSQTNNTQR
jgi:hypothetical protein